MTTATATRLAWYEGKITNPIDEFAEGVEVLHDVGVDRWHKLELLRNATVAVAKDGDKWLIACGMDRIFPRCTMVLRVTIEVARNCIKTLRYSADNRPRQWSGHQPNETMKNQALTYSRPFRSNDDQ